LTNLVGRVIVAVVVLILAALLLSLAACGGSGSTPTPSPPPAALDGVWGEYAAIYRDFYLDSYAQAEDGHGGHAASQVEELALLDLDQNGTPELVIYANGGASRQAMAVYTLEDGEVCSMTRQIPYGEELELQVPAAANAVEGFFTGIAFHGILDEAKYRELDETPVCFLRYTDGQTGERVYLLRSDTPDAAETGLHSVREYRFGAAEGGLAAEVLWQYQYLMDENGVEIAQWRFDGVICNQVEAEKHIADWNTEREARYTPNLGEDYSLCDSGRVDDADAPYARQVEKIEAFFNSFIRAA
jgi:hypothetical protein